MEHTTISPAILYWGTPIVLITTVNEDGSPNICPMSSAWWLSDRCFLGLAGGSQTTINLLRTKQCVLNLPDDTLTTCVNALARTTGSEQVPDFKINLGYRYDKDKFKTAGLTPQDSVEVLPPRIRECPVQMETELIDYHELLKGGPSELEGFLMALEVRIIKTHVFKDLRLAGHENRIDADKWKPMIMSFQKLYGLRDGELGQSTLADIDEENYRFSR